jgi:hypothetical protein
MNSVILLGVSGSMGTTQSNLVDLIRMEKEHTIEVSISTRAKWNNLFYFDYLIKEV